MIAAELITKSKQLKQTCYRSDSDELTGSAILSVNIYSTFTVSLQTFSKLIDTGMPTELYAFCSFVMCLPVSCLYVVCYVANETPVLGHR